MVDFDAGLPTLRFDEGQMKLWSDWTWAPLREMGWSSGKAPHRGYLPEDRAFTPFLNAFSCPVRLRFTLQRQYTILQENQCAFCWLKTKRKYPVLSLAD